MVRIDNIQVIAPDLETIASISGSINLIRQSKEHWNAFLQVKFAVFISHRNGLGNGSYFVNNKGVWFANRDKVNRESTVYNAGTLIHEAKHMAQFFSKKELSLNEMEEEAYDEQVRFLRGVGEHEIAEERINTKKKGGWKKFVEEHQEDYVYFEKILAELIRQKMLNADS